jgi:plastocyanin
MRNNCYSPTVLQAAPGETITFELASTGSVVEFLAQDVPAGAEASAAEDDEPGRYDLVRALFPDAEIGETVRIRVPAGA